MIPSVELNRVVDQNKKIHPHKFILWVGIGSIIMMFAGLTSAYIVKRDQPGWTTFTIPRAFWYSTAVILVSSLTIQMALRAFKMARSALVHARGYGGSGGRISCCLSCCN